MLMGRSSLFTSSRWRRPLVVVVAAVALISSTRSSDAAPRQRAWTVAPPAAWVHELPLPDRVTVATAQAASGKVYLLLDDQVRLGSQTVSYSRRAWTAVSTEGVQNASEIQIDFDPSYERLVIHHVRLLRDGRDVFSFTPGDVRIIQQESDLDEQIYSGELTAVVFLRDLRPGDVLDYAYSLEGGNPILAGGYDDVVWLRYGSPVQVLRHVITAPSAVPLHIAPRNTALAPSIATNGPWRSYTWEARDVAAQVMDDDEPGWFDPDPRVEISTFESWGAVARWASDLFESQLRPSPEIRRLADRWRAAPGGAMAAAAEAARFVQDEVRYLGIELGPNSQQPHPPAQVLRQRFGDCKDKALLLVALLRELGIDAAPALVNTTVGRGLDAMQPSAFAFDHAIVQAIIGGRTLWIDATESAKGGALDEWDPPDFERALVLRVGVERLVEIPRPAWREPPIEVKETYTFAAPGAPVRLDVVSTYRGVEADDMRRTLAATSQEDLAKKYLDYYARDYADIRALRAPATRDDRARNLVTVTEWYEVTRFWKRGERELYGWQVRAKLPRTAASTRKAPLAVPHPVHVVQQVIVRGPRTFRVDDRHETITDQAFAFSSDLVVRGAEMRLTFDYRSRADSVPPERIKAHQEAIDRVKDELSFVLSSDMLEGPTVVSATWLPFATLGLLGGAVALVRARRRRRPA